MNEGAYAMPVCVLFVSSSSSIVFNVNTGTITDRRMLACILSGSQTWTTPAKAGTHFCWPVFSQRAGADNRIFYHGRVLNMGPLDWLSSILTTRTLPLYTCLIACVWFKK